MEILAEIAFALLQVVGELVLQMVFELLAELGVRGVGETFRRSRPANPLLAAVGYAVLGAAAGGLSLLMFPSSVIDSPTLRVANLVCTPLAAGAVMSLVGAWRRRKDQELIRLDRFAYGFLFALAMALVRFAWATPG